MFAQFRSETESHPRETEEPLSVLPAKLIHHVVVIESFSVSNVPNIKTISVENSSHFRINSITIKEDITSPCMHSPRFDGTLYSIVDSFPFNAAFFSLIDVKKYTSLVHLRYPDVPAEKVLQDLVNWRIIAKEEALVSLDL